MANYVYTTRTYTVKDSYNGNWQQGALTIEVDANGNGTWTLAMTNSQGGNGYTSVSLRLYINGTKIYNNYYSGSSKYPTKNNTSSTGNFTVSASLEKFTVDFGVCCMQSARYVGDATATEEKRLTNGAMTRLGSATSDPVWGEYFTRTKATYTVTFDPNGGNTPSPTSKSVTSDSTYGTLATCTRPNYNFLGWYTSDGTEITSSSVVNLSGDQTLYAQWELAISDCGAPTVAVYAGNDYGNDYFYVRTTAGSDGTGNAVSSIELFVTIDGSTPSTTNFQFHVTRACSAGGNIYSYFYLSSWPVSAIEYYFGTDWSGTIKAVARTRGVAGSDFYSDLSTTSTATFNYMGHSTNGVKITCPSPSGLVCGCDNSYVTVTWEDDDLNVGEYMIQLRDIDTNEWQWIGYAYDPYCSFCTGDYLTPGHRYGLVISKYDNNYNYISDTYSVGEIIAKDITRFTTPAVEILPCSFPNTKPYWRGNEDRMLYMSNGSGNLCKLVWPRAIASNNKLKGYEVHIDVFDREGSAAVTMLAEFIGDKNEYYIKADKLASVIKTFEDAGFTADRDHQCIECSITVIAKSAYGEVYDSYSESGGRFYLINGNGLYVRTGESAGHPIMKRALTFINNGANWQFAYDVDKKDNNGTWSHSDTRYETITNKQGELVLDLETDEPIYTY